MTGLLGQVLLKAMRRCKTDEARVKAVLRVLGLEKNDVIIDRDDLALVLEFAAAAEDTLTNEYGVDRPGSFSEEEDLAADKAWHRLAKFTDWDDR